MTRSAPLSDVIISPANPKVKRLVRLRSRRHRDGERAFIIEGFRELSKAAGAGLEISELYVCENLFLGVNEPALIKRLTEAGARLIHLAEGPFRKAAYRDRPEGLLAVAPHFPAGLDGLENRMDQTGPMLILVAEGIEKPGNLGTMLRTADAAGAHAVIAADPRTDLFNPNVVRSSVGSLFTVPVATAPADETREWLRCRGVAPLLARPNAPAPHWESDLTGPTAIVIGSEQLGLTPAWLNQGHPQARIPMAGKADSLNAAMATGVLLFEAVRQRSKVS